MAVLPILIAPHPTLKAKAKPVKDVTDELRALLDQMELEESETDDLFELPL